MTTTTKNLSNQESNYLALESPLRELEEAIKKLKSDAASHSALQAVEDAFHNVKAIVFPTE